MQRVSNASVAIDGVVRAGIGRGLVVLLGVERGDTPDDAEALADKIVHLRIFSDEDGRMNVALAGAAGELLVISQFTLAGDCRKGRRPSFDHAAPPEEAKALYEHFLDACARRGAPAQSGLFQAAMEVSLTNSGPVTLLLSSRKEF